MNKSKTYKNEKGAIYGKYKLNEEDQEKYDLIEEQDERGIEINDRDLSDRIFDTLKKENKK